MYINLEKVKEFSEIEPASDFIMTLIKALITTPETSSINITAQVALKNLNMLVPEQKEVIKERIKYVPFVDGSIPKSNGGPINCNKVVLEPKLTEETLQGGKLAASFKTEVRLDMLSKGYNPLSSEDVAKYYAGEKSTGGMLKVAGEHITSLGSPTESLIEKNVELYATKL